MMFQKRAFLQQLGALAKSAGCASQNYWMKDHFNGLALEDALQAAINLLRDSAESGRMPSGVALPASANNVHRAAAELLEDALRYNRATAARLTPP